MKYKITHSKAVKKAAQQAEDEEVNPFSVTLTLDTEEEIIHFHDMIAPLLTGAGMHPFHGAIFRAGFSTVDFDDPIFKGTIQRQK